jgi:hypothetical protein
VTCRLDDVSDMFAEREVGRKALTIEYIVVSLLLDLSTQSCRYRGVRGIVIGYSSIAPLRRLPTHDVAAPLRWFPLNLALALLRQLPLHRARLRIHTRNTATPSIAHADLPAIPAAPPARRRTGKPARRTSTHGRVLALETLASPSVAEAERVEMLFVLFFRRCPVFGPRHRLTGLVDVAGPSLVGVCGVGLGEGVVVGVAGAPEEGLGTGADGHCRVVLRIWMMLCMPPLCSGYVQCETKE